MGYRLSVAVTECTITQEHILTRMIRQAGPMKLQMKLCSVLSQHLNKILITQYSYCKTRFTLSEENVSEARLKYYPPYFATQTFCTVKINGSI